MESFGLAKKYKKYQEVGQCNSVVEHLTLKSFDFQSVNSVQLRCNNRRLHQRIFDLLFSLIIYSYYYWKRNHLNATSTFCRTVNNRFVFFPSVFDDDNGVDDHYIIKLLKMVFHFSCSWFILCYACVVIRLSKNGIKLSDRYGIVNSVNINNLILFQIKEKMVVLYKEKSNVFRLINSRIMTIRHKIEVLGKKSKGYGMAFFRFFCFPRLSFCYFILFSWIAQKQIRHFKTCVDVVISHFANFPVT